MTETSLPCRIAQLASALSLCPWLRFVSYTKKIHSPLVKPPTMAVVTTERYKHNGTAERVSVNTSSKITIHCVSQSREGTQQFMPHLFRSSSSRDSPRPPSTTRRVQEWLDGVTPGSISGSDAGRRRLAGSTRSSSRASGLPASGRATESSFRASSTSGRALLSQHSPTFESFFDRGYLKERVRVSESWDNGPARSSRSSRSRSPSQAGTGFSGSRHGSRLYRSPSACGTAVPGSRAPSSYRKTSRNTWDRNTLHRGSIDSSNPCRKNHSGGEHTVRGPSNRHGNLRRSPSVNGHANAWGSSYQPQSAKTPLQRLPGTPSVGKLETSSKNKKASYAGSQRPAVAQLTGTSQKPASEKPPAYSSDPGHHDANSRRSTASRQSVEGTILVAESVMPYRVEQHMPIEVHHWHDHSHHHVHHMADGKRGHGRAFVSRDVTGRLQLERCKRGKDHKASDDKSIVTSLAKYTVGNYY